MSVTEVEPFPYKREFMNPDELWNNAVTQDLAVPVILPEHQHWKNVPYRIKWEFTDPIRHEKIRLGFVVSDDVYEKVNRLVDYFSEPARMDACRRNHPSPLDFYKANFDRVQNRAQELVAAQPDLPYRHHLREAVYEMSKECTTFKISVTKAVFKMFKSRMVLDPSAGWGDRILGAAAGGVVAYHGIDPNPNLRPAYDEILDFIKTHPTPETTNPDQYTILTEDFLQANIPEEAYDTVFTSPPFYDYEIYVRDPKQSIQGKTDLDSWLNDFFYPYLKKAWKALAKGGHFILYIADVPGTRYTEKMWRYITNQLGGKFLGIIAVTNQNISYGNPIWVWRKS